MGKLTKRQPLKPGLATAFAQSPRALQRELLGEPDPGEVRRLLQALRTEPEGRRLKIPKPLAGRRINWARIFYVLLRARLVERRRPAHEGSVTKTWQRLQKLRKAAAPLVADHNINPAARRQLGSVKAKAEVWMAVLAVHRRLRKKGGRPGAPKLNALLAELIDEVRGATGSPHWHFVLKLVEVFLPSTFPPHASIHHLRVRVRHARGRGRQPAR